jgi:hypothetical protein
VSEDVVSVAAIADKAVGSVKELECVVSVTAIVDKAI